MDIRRNAFLFERRIHVFALLSFLIYGSVVCQDDLYLYCPAEDWIEGSTITLHCSVVKSKYPSRCQTGFTNTVRFRRSDTDSGYVSNCTLNNVTTTCTPSSASCACVNTGNTTHFNFEFQFTAHSGYGGYWQCYIVCNDGLVTQLVYGSSNCQNRTIEEQTTMPPTTTAPQDDGNTTDDGADRTAAIAGGVCGGLAFVGLIVLLWFLNAKYMWVPSLVCCCKGKSKTSAPDSGDGKARELMNGDKQGAGSGANTTSSARQTQQTGESKHKGSGSGAKKNRPPKEQETELSTVRETSSPSQDGSAEEDERRHQTARALPQPKAAGEDSIGLAGSATPRKLPPLKQSGMPSVERNSFVEPGHTRDLPLPSIKQKM